MDPAVNRFFREPIEAETRAVYETPKDQRIASLRLLQSTLASAADHTRHGVSERDKRAHTLVMATRMVVDLLLVYDGVAP